MGECKEKEQGEEEEGGRGKQAGHLSLDSEKGRCPGSGRIHQKRKVQDSSASHMNSIVIRPCKYMEPDQPVIASLLSLLSLEHPSRNHV